MSRAVFDLKIEVFIGLKLKLFFKTCVTLVGLSRQPHNKGQLNLTIFLLYYHTALTEILY